jgi:hypothetical protein
VIAADSVERQAGAYAVAAQERHIDLFLHSGTARPHRYPIRFMREAMLRTYEDAGGVIFHAAGVDAGGAGVMVNGRRGAGKTTITAALLRSGGAALLSNDRLIACQASAWSPCRSPCRPHGGPSRHSPSWRSPRAA